MIESQEKVEPEENNGNDGPPRKDYPWKKAKKCAVMISFSGKNYLGMQRNTGHKTIEGDLMKAFKDSGAIDPEWHDNPSKAFFQRASRTDKGVSAAKMVVSLKILNEEGIIEKINNNLPFDIRVMDIKRVTKNFNSKNSCDARTYLYLLPTLAFAPIEDIVTEKYRISEETQSSVNNVLSQFIGPHYFHNYTSGKLPMEPSSQRFITEFEIGKPFIRQDLEFAIIKIKGQSFMLHQIRKMIGMTIAIVKGYVSGDIMKQTLSNERIDIPKAPGLGLLLQQVHYEKYNRKFGTDGMHEDLTWKNVEDQVEKFKEDFIFSDIIETEIKEKSMMDWLSNLPKHKFEQRHFESSQELSPLEIASLHVKKTQSSIESS